MNRLCIFAMVSAPWGPVGCAPNASAPAKSADTGGAVIVIMAGCFAPYSTMQDIERAVRDEIAEKLRRYYDGAAERVPSGADRAAHAGVRKDKLTIHRKGGSVWLEGDYDAFVKANYDAWARRKRAGAGRLEQFVAIGHSSGATGIYNELRKGTFKDGRCMPAFLGLVDMILPLTLRQHDLTGRLPRDSDAKGGGLGRTAVVHYHLPTTGKIQGVENVVVRGTNHYEIPKAPAVVEGLANEAARACMQRIRDTLRMDHAKSACDGLPAGDPQARLCSRPGLDEPGARDRQWIEP